MMGQTLLFVDIETLGIDRGHAIWEVAAARYEGGVCVGEMSTFVRHDPAMIDPELPPLFQVDYRKRYDPSTAISPVELFDVLGRYAEGRAIVCGSNPAFDIDRLEALAAEHDAPAPPWHYHPIDVPVMAHGYLLGKGIAPAPPWRSDFLSQAVGVDPTFYGRHTAAGDVAWCRAIWLAIGGK